MKTPFLGSAYESRSKILNAQRLINLYPEIVETQDGKSIGALYPCPGKVLRATVGSGPIRGGIAPRDGNAYVVSGDEVYKLDSLYTATLLGTLLSSTGAVSMAANQTQVAIADGEALYVVTLSTGALATNSTYAATAVAFVDQYIIFSVGSSAQWRITAAADASSIDPLDVVTSEGSPDDLVTLLADHREVWTFGTDSTEVWINGGVSDFPFERTQFIESGCAAAASPQKMDNSVFWLDRNEYGQGVVRRADGYVPRRVSTHAIERAMKSYSTISDAIGFVYQDEGHSFYQLNFPSGNATWVYDASTGLWHERDYRDPNSNEYGRDRANCHFFFNGQHFVGDHADGRLYAYSLDTFADAGNTRRWLRSWRAVAEQNVDPLKRLSVSRLQIDGEVGRGLVTGQGSDPQAMLRVSEDGGNTWSNEIWVSIGAIGQYGKRVMFEQLGDGQDIVFELSGTDPVPIGWTNAYMDASYGR